MTGPVATGAPAGPGPHGKQRFIERCHRQRITLAYQQAPLVTSSTGEDGIVKPTADPLPDLSAYPCFLTIPQVAELLGVHENSVRRRISAGQMPHIRDGRILRVPRDGLLAYLASRMPSAPNRGTP